MSVFTIRQGFSQNSQLFFMFQCNGLVEMNKCLCTLACTWVTMIDSQSYIIDILSLDVSLEYNANPVCMLIL